MPSKLSARLRAGLLASSALAAVVAPAAAQNATWLANPPNNNFNDSGNWTPAVVPTGTATFGASTQTFLFVSGPSPTVGGFTFNSSAPTYSFQIFSGLTFNGAGIVNNSSNAQALSVQGPAILTFLNASSAGNAAIGGTLGTANFRDTSTAANMSMFVGPYRLNFFDSSTAGNATIQGTVGLIVTFNDNSKAGNAFITLIRSTMEFHNNSSADNANIVSSSAISGGMTFFDSSTAGNARIDNQGGTQLRFFDSSNAGTANITNRGAISFSGSSSAANSTILNNFILTFAGTSTAANATITMNSGATTTFFNTSSGGQSRFILNGTAEIDISNLTSAGTTLGSVEQIGKVSLGSKNLAIGTNNLSTTFDGVIADGGTGGGIGGSLTKTGTGTLTLTLTNTYTGATTVNAGTLAVNGSIVSSSGVTVNAGGTVGGTGALPKTVINGGSLSPGTSIGTISISGSLTFVGAGNYIVEVSPSAADKTNVSGAPGTATLAGTLSAIGTGGTYIAGTKYAVLNATGGVSGTFSNLAISGSFGAAKPHIEYDANNVYLVLDQNQVSPSLIGGTRNQRAVASAIDSALMGGSQNAAFVALFGLTAAQLPGALDQLSGEVHPSTAGVLLDESLYARSAVLGRLRQASYGGNAQMASLSAGGPTAFADGEELTALAYAKSPIVTKAPPMSSQPGYDVVFWAHGFGAAGKFDSDGNAAALRRDLAGFFSGVDTRVGTNGRLGLMAGYTGSRNNLDGRGGSTVETGHISGYGGWSFGALNLRGGAAYAWYTIDTSRVVSFPGFFDSLTAHYNGGTGQIFGEAGYGFAFGKIAVEPFAGVAFVRLNTDAFNERGGAAALAVRANTFEVGYSTFGIRAASMIPLAADMVLVPRASVAWQHAFENVTPADTLALQSAAVPFVIAGVPIARDAALAEAGLDLAIGRHATIGVSYTGQIANNVRDHAAKGKFTWKF